MRPRTDWLIVALWSKESIDRILGTAGDRTGMIARSL
jgi:hypothetical protein